MNAWTILCRRIIQKTLTKREEIIRPAVLSLSILHLPPPVPPALPLILPRATGACPDASRCATSPPVRSPVHRSWGALIRVDVCLPRATSHRPRCGHACSPGSPPTRALARRHVRPDVRLRPAEPLVPPRHSLS